MISETFERTRRLVFLALLAAFAVALHTIEAGLPNPTPWLRLGLANIIVLLTLAIYGFKDGMVVSLLRIFIGSIISTGFLGPAFFMSLSGGITSTTVMYLAWKYLHRFFSLIGISIIGAYTHTFTQVTVAYLFFIRHEEVFILMPIFLTVAVITGFVNGLLTHVLYHHLKRITRPLP